MHDEPFPSNPGTRAAGSILTANLSKFRAGSHASLSRKPGNWELPAPNRRSLPMWKSLAPSRKPASPLPGRNATPTTEYKAKRKLFRDRVSF